MLTRRHRRSAPGRRGGRDQTIAALYGLAKAIANSTQRAAHIIVPSEKRGTWHGSGKRKARRPRWQARSLVNMTGEQRLDYLAACDGKITWARYYAKWGPSL